MKLLYYKLLKKCLRQSMNKFERFDDNELYILKRMCIESSFKFFATDNYNDAQLKIHTDLNEMIHKEIDKRNDR